MNFLGDTNTYEKLKKDPTRLYKKKVEDLLQKLEKEQTTILPSISSRSHPLHLWTAKDPQTRDPTQTNSKKHQFCHTIFPNT